VPCAWVSSRGECERFVYYDGPSLDGPPVSVEAKGRGELVISSAAANGNVPSGAESRRDLAGELTLNPVDQTARKGRRGERRGMLVDVRNGMVSAGIVPVPSGARPPPAPLFTIGLGERPSVPESTLREWIIDAGLSAAEADGMMACWRERFFKKEGRRFILLMSAADYDSLCPIQIKPTPTEMARVGLVWTELQQ